MFSISVCAELRLPLGNSPVALLFWSSASAVAWLVVEQLFLHTHDEQGQQRPEGMSQKA